MCIHGGKKEGSDGQSTILPQLPRLKDEGTKRFRCGTSSSIYASEDSETSLPRIWRSMDSQRKMAFEIDTDDLEYPIMAALPSLRSLNGSLRNLSEDPGREATDSIKQHTEALVRSWSRLAPISPSHGKSSDDKTPVLGKHIVEHRSVKSPNSSVSELTDAHNNPHAIESFLENVKFEQISELHEAPSSLATSSEQITQIRKIQKPPLPLGSNTFSRKRPVKGVRSPFPPPTASSNSSASASPEPSTSAQPSRKPQPTDARRHVSEPPKKPDHNRASSKRGSRGKHRKITAANSLNIFQSSAESSFGSLSDVLGANLKLNRKEINRFLRSMFDSYCGSDRDSMGQPNMSKTTLCLFFNEFFGSRFATEMGEWMSSFDLRVSQRHADCDLRGAVAEMLTNGGLGFESFLQIMADVEDSITTEAFETLVSERHFLCGGDGLLLTRVLKSTGDDKKELDLRPAWR